MNGQDDQLGKSLEDNKKLLPTTVLDTGSPNTHDARYILTHTSSYYRENVLDLVNTWMSNKLIDPQSFPSLYEDIYYTLQRHSQELGTVFDDHLPNKHGTYQQNILPNHVTPHETCHPNHMDNCWSEDLTLTAEDYSGTKDWDRNILDDFAVGYLPPVGYKMTNTIPQGKHIPKPAPILDTKDNPHNKGERDIENDMRHAPPDPKTTLAQEKGE